MEYRKLGKTNEKVSILGLGTMRLPTLDNSNSKIDKEKASELLSYGIDKGINLIDTGYSFHSKEVHGGPGTSEPFVGEFLENGYRDKVYLQTKCPSWLFHSRAVVEYILDEQLKNCSRTHI